MKLETWEVELLYNMKRILNQGVSRGIETKNSELLDYCNHLLDLLCQINYEKDIPSEY